MPTVYIDADACPVKDEVYRVARRYGMRVAVVANAPLRVPADALIELVVRPGFGGADDWIAEQSGAGDVVVTADVPLAAAVWARVPACSTRRAVRSRIGTSARRWRCAT